jgi:REP element-mobilizing transposase RayT
MAHDVERLRVDPEVAIAQFLEILNDVKSGYGIRLLAYVFMGNHYHLLLAIPAGVKQATLSGFLHKLHSRFAHWYNAQADRRGQVFLERVKTPVVVNKKYLRNTIRYIHDNPVKAGLCEKPGDWKHSSFTAIVSNHKEGYGLDVLDRSTKGIKLIGFRTITAKWLKGEVDAHERMEAERLREEIGAFVKRMCRVVIGEPKHRAKLHDELGMPQLVRGPWAVGK